MTRGKTIGLTRRIFVGIVMPLLFNMLSRLVITFFSRTTVVHGILYARILEGVAFPFSRGSSQPRDQSQVSHIAGGFFTS